MRSPVAQITTVNCCPEKSFCVHKIVLAIVIIISATVTIVDQLYQKLAKDEYERYIVTTIVDGVNAVIITLMAIFGLNNLNRTKYSVEGTKVLVDDIELGTMDRRNVTNPGVDDGLLESNNNNRGRRFIPSPHRKPTPSAPPKMPNDESVTPLIPRGTGKEVEEVDPNYNPNNDADRIYPRLPTPQPRLTIPEDTNLIFDACSGDVMEVSNYMLDRIYTNCFSLDKTTCWYNFEQLNKSNCPFPNRDQCWLTDSRKRQMYIVSADQMNTVFLNCINVNSVKVVHNFPRPPGFSMNCD